MIERARDGPPREPEAEQQGERKADDELAEEGSGREFERVDDRRPARRVVKDEAVVGEPGVRSGEVGDRRGRRLLEAQHHVVDDGKGEREEQVRDRRSQEEPARELRASSSRTAVAAQPVPADGTVCTCAAGSCGAGPITGYLPPGDRSLKAPPSRR